VITRWPGLQQHALLLLPGVTVERIAVDEHDRLAAAVVLVVELDVGAVLLADCDGGHGRSLSLGADTRR
jgi:hypothetical protein